MSTTPTTPASRPRPLFRAELDKIVESLRGDAGVRTAVEGMLATVSIVVDRHGAEGRLALWLGVWMDAACPPYRASTQEERRDFVAAFRRSAAERGLRLGRLLPVDRRHGYDFLLILSITNPVR